MGDVLSDTSKTVLGEKLRSFTVISKNGTSILLSSITAFILKMLVPILS